MTTATATGPPPPFTADNTPAAATVTQPPLLSIKEEYTSDGTVAPPALREEPQDFSPIANHSSVTPPCSQELQSVRQPPHFIDSITELENLSGALTAFHNCYNDLHNHLESIKAAILSKMPSEPQNNTTLPLLALPCKELAFGPDEKELTKQQQQQQLPPKSEVESLCKLMCSRGLRKYLATNLSDLPKLREEVPKALKLAQNPAKLVLDCSGRFFLQGSRAYTKDSPMIPAREASIFVLECFLLMMGMEDTDGKGNGVVKIDKGIKEEADTAAVAWRKRLVLEGGLAKANDIDARGLLLFVSCFGIPAAFKWEDMRDLLRANNPKEILDVLQKSSVLMNKISALLQEMTKNKMDVDAVDIVYTFRLEEKFDPQKILISVLQEAKESWKKAKQLARGSSAALNEANKKHLAALKTVIKCLDEHKIDPAKLLPGWQITSKIFSLEKDIAVIDKKTVEKAAQKRRADETEASKKPHTHEAKRARFTGHDGPQQQIAAGHGDSRRNLQDSGLLGHAINYSVPAPVVYGGPVAGMLPENMLPSGVASSISVSHGGIVPGGSYAGVHGGRLADAAGQMINHTSQPYAWSVDASLGSRYTGQASSVGLTSLYRPSPSVEVFAGMPNASSVGAASRKSGSDLYQFADAVVESELYPNSIPRSIGTVPGALPGYHSSYMY